MRLHGGFHQTSIFAARGRAKLLCVITDVDDANVAKHSRASEVTVSVTADDTNLFLRVQDNGIGGANVGKGSGLIGLFDRVEALGGQFQIECPPDGGTSLHAAIPLGLQ
jgi:glucose-6-phosphate-specific signal transduction histidine kinase